MSESNLMPLVRFHLQYNRLYHDAELRGRHLDAIEKACDAVRGMPATIERIIAFEKAYDDAMQATKNHDERSKEND